MKTSLSATRRNQPHRAQIMAATALAVFLGHHTAMGAQAPVSLGTAGQFAILAKSGISAVPPCMVTGNLGVSPIDSTAITGFSLILDSSLRFSTSSQVVGKLYAADYASPTPANLTTAVSDMETAYTDAAGRTLPDATELGAGNIGGMTIAPGLYKWGSGVSIPTDVTLAGGPNDVWIFQIAGNLTIAGAQSVLLSGGANAGNIFWQVAGGVGVDVGTTAHMEGIILAQAGINMQTGASINGKLLAQTAVTLDANAVTIAFGSTVGLRLLSAVAVADPYFEAAGQFIDLATRTITVPPTGSIRFYHIVSDPTVTISGVSLAGGGVVIRYN